MSQSSPSGRVGHSEADSAIVVHVIRSRILYQPSWRPTLRGDAQRHQIAIRWAPDRFARGVGDMGQAIGIARTEHTAEALRLIAAKCRDGAQVRRLLAIALILEGKSAGTNETPRM
jgi:hypothetical protein